jgi:hypothetical protein
VREAGRTATSFLEGCVLFSSYISSDIFSPSCILHSLHRLGDPIAALSWPKYPYWHGGDHRGVRGGALHSF